MTTKTAPALTNEQIQEVLTLLQESDSVELKLTVPESHQVATIRSLELDPLEAQIRQVFFFDTPDLALDAQGVVVRARRIQGKGNDSIVKLRPVVPHELPEELRTAAGFRVEVDALPGGFVCSGTMKGTPADVLGTVHGERPLSKLFSKEQRAFYRAQRRRDRARRPVDPRPDLRPQAAVHAEEARSPSRRGNVALPGRLAGARALDASQDRAKRSRSQPSCAPFSPIAAWTSRATRRRRPARRFSTSRRV